ncbi:hypothetical protein Leryth_026983 [Lithospermum erythrorhizon]|nr:hypothetical protein Leryth_026983 [Lithospermum erythrorhizon]
MIKRQLDIYLPSLILSVWLALFGIKRMWWLLFLGRIRTFSSVFSLHAVFFNFLETPQLKVYIFVTEMSRSFTRYPNSRESRQANYIYPPIVPRRAGEGIIEAIRPAIHGPRNFKTFNLEIHHHPHSIRNQLVRATIYLKTSN